MNNNNVEIQFFPNEAIKAIQRYKSKKMEVFSLVKGANAVLYVIRSFSENTEKFDLVAYGETGFLETIRKNAANLSENSNAETVFQAKHCLKKIQLLIQTLVSEYGIDNQSKIICSGEKQLDISSIQDIEQFINSII